MTSENSNKENGGEKVVDINAEERMPAVNSAPAVIDMLREAIERAADNERKKARRELFAVNAVLILFLMGITGVFVAIAFNLVKELQAERNLSRDLMLATMRHQQTETMPHDPDLNKTLRDIISTWDPKQDMEQDKPEPAVPTDEPEPKAIPEETHVTETPQPRQDEAVPRPETVRSIKAEMADLEAEADAINILASTGRDEDTDLLKTMVAEREQALSQLRERIRKTHSTIIDRSEGGTARQEAAPPEIQDAPSQKPESRYIAIDAAGTGMRILKPVP